MKKISKILIIFFTLSTSSSFAKSKPNIVILATGGTIAGTGKSSHEASYSAAKITIDELIKSMPELSEKGNIIGEQFSQIASQDMDSDFLLKLAKRVDSLANKNRNDAIIITHGTDTLEETAYFLNLTVKSRKPIILVGSMRPSTSLSADGALNLYNAVALAADRESRSKGVLVMFNDRIYSARDVTKTHTSNVASFDSPNSGAIGHVIYGKAKFYYEPTRRHTHNTKFDIRRIKSLPKVDIIYGYNNQEASIIDQFINSKSAGIVVAGVGDGNSHKDTLNKLINASKNGVIIARSSRGGGGFVIPNAEINDDEYGFVTADNLNPQKARILLMLALSKTKNYKSIQDYFWEY